MAVGTWAVATLCAGALGWLGPYVIARLPASVDAEPDAPSYADIAGVGRLSIWLAVGAAVLVTIVAVAVPANLLPAWVVVCGVGIWLAYIDDRTRLLPTRLVWPLYAAALVAIAIEAVLASDVSIFVRAVATSLVGFGIFWIFWWVGELWRAGGFGYGDVRFSAPLGLVLGSVGVWPAVIGLYLGILIGGIVGVVRKFRGHDEGFALGPWMLLGAALGPLLT